MRQFGPVCLLLAAWVTAGPADPILRFASGEFRPTGAPESARVATRSAAGSLYLVAVTDGPLSPDDRRRLEEAGAEILDYVPDNGYRLRLAPSAERGVRDLAFVRWLGQVPSSLKIAPAIATRAATGASELPLRIVLNAGEPVDRVTAALSGLETVARPSGKDGAWRVTAHIPGDRVVVLLSKLSALPEVEAIEPARRFLPLNQDAVWVHQSFVGPSPQQIPIFDRGIYGCGEIVAVADTGQDYDHCGFSDTAGGPPPIESCTVAPCPGGIPAPGLRKDILYYNWSGTATGDDDTCPASITGGSGHGTHTSGSAAADSPPYADCTGFTTAGRNEGDGLAPGAKLVIQELGDHLEYLNDLGGSVWNLADVAFGNGARIHSYSWGTACQDLPGVCIPGCTIPYDSAARDADLAMWMHPDLLLVMSAGNVWVCPPPNSIGSPAVAKSPIVVGAAGHGLQAGEPLDFSSPGPVFDGRLRPTLAAQGESTVSTASDASPDTDNCSICASSGTSMAAPTIAGLAALVREYFAEGFYAAGSRNSASGFEPSAALVKSVLIDGAGAAGRGPSPPDFRSGYGRVQLDRTLAFAGSEFALRAFDDRVGIATGGVATHAFDVAEGTPLRFTLVWNDYPAALNAAVARVNSLKLEVLDPHGNVWFQTLDSVTGLPRATSTATDAHDSLNVEERLVFDEPTPGRWVVRVRGLDVPWGPQPYALLVRGAIADCAAPAAPGAPTLGVPADRQVAIGWTAVPSALSYTIERSAGGCAALDFVQVASAVAGTSFLDPDVSGGVTYGYRVSAASDLAGNCLSEPSACTEVEPTGPCTLPPLFHGASGAASAGSVECGIHLAWEAASSYCGDSATYSVYRGTLPDFTPSAATRVTRCLGGLEWTDQSGLLPGVRYHYVVRAEDTTTGNGGPCNGGNEDSNLVRASAIPVGPPAVDVFVDDAGDTGSASMIAVPPWSMVETGGDAGPRVYQASYPGAACAYLATPVLTLTDSGGSPQLTFRTRHSLEYNPLGFLGPQGSFGEVQIATGPAFGDWTRLPLTPDYPALVTYSAQLCGPPPDIATYFAGSAPSYSTYSASLVDWIGEEVRIRFFLTGDVDYPSGDWWIDEISVSGVLLPQDCAPLATGPPPVPDGFWVPGEPLRASRAGSEVALVWDADTCPASEVNVYSGVLGAYTSFTAGACGLPADGSATVRLPGGSWFVVAATDGATTDGSYGRDGSGAERAILGASSACPAIVAHATSQPCP